MICGACSTAAMRPTAPSSDRINRITYRRTGRTDPDTGEDRRARILPPQGRFRLDPHSPVVYALENLDPSTGTATKATIFRERVIAARTPHSHADSPADAIAICLDRAGAIELPAIADLLGTDEHQARQALQGLAFTDPEKPEKLVPAAEYLSGNVRRKLTTAIAAAHDADDDRWEENIAALQQVIPADLTPAEISAHLGAAWIDAPIIHQFLTELLQDASVQVEHPGGST